MDGDEQVAEESGEDGERGRNLVPLRAGHLDAARNDREQADGRAKQRGLSCAANNLPELTQEGGPEGEGVEQGVVVQSLKNRS